MNIIIIGAGASGLMAAISAAENGAHVTIIEHQKKSGKKLSITGNGKCNFTNKALDYERQEFKNKYYGNATFISEVLRQYSLKNTLDFFNKIGVYSYCDPVYGGYYPHSNQAVSLTNSLIDYAEKLGVKIKTNNFIKKISKTNNGFAVDVGIVLECHRLILATGGYHSMIEGLSGYEIAEQLGHSITVLKPSLTALIAKDELNKASGVRFYGGIGLQYDREYRGEIQITEYGISGIPVFNISHLVKENDTVFIDFLPRLMPEKYEFDNFAHQLYDMLTTYNSERQLFKVLVGMIPEKILEVMFHKLKINKSILIKDIFYDEIFNLVLLLKSYRLRIDKRRGFDYAQVTQGGVFTDEIEAATMESKFCKNLYFAGEIMDVDGICGGYNLQWAWSTGYLAGASAAQSLKRSLNKTNHYR